MNAPQFAAEHGDAATWCPGDIEREQNLAAIDQPRNPERTAYTIAARWCAQQATVALQQGDHATAQEYRDGMNRCIDALTAHSQPTREQHTTAA